MTTKLAVLVSMVLCASPLWAQDSNGPAADPEDPQISWESYQKVRGATRLGFELKTIAAGQHPTPPPPELGKLIAEALSDGERDSKEGALMAIASKSGVLHPPTPENFAMWTTYREVLVSFRGQVEALLYDRDDWLQSSAFLARSALDIRPGDAKWVLDPGEDSVRLYRNLFDQDPRPSVRSGVLKLFWLCDCRESLLDERKQLFRDAIYDSDPGIVRQAIRGAGDLQITDMLERVVQDLKDPDDLIRSDAATALQGFGRDAERYAGEVRQALAIEKSEEIRALLEAGLATLEGNTDLLK